MKSILAWIIFALAAAGCLYWVGTGVVDNLREDAVFYDVIRSRADRARKGNTLHIGVVGTWERHGHVLQGLEYALQELNAEGGILGRKVELEVQDDHGTIDGALTAAQSFAMNPDIGIVIGHTEILLNITAAQNYAFYKMLAISPTAPLTGSGNYEMQFSNGLSPRQLGRTLLELAERERWQRIGLIYTKSRANQNQARLIESMAESRLMEIPLSVAYDGQDLTEEMIHWERELGLDAYVLSLNEEDTAQLMLALRQVDAATPLVSTGSGLPAGMDAKVAGIRYFLDNTRKATVGKLAADSPDSEFSLGYETLMLVAKAAGEAGSLLPEDVALALTKLQTDPPLISTIRFDSDGNAVKAGLGFTRTQLP